MRVSPTQITTGRACLRRYAWVYGHDIREPSSPAKDRGTAVHGIIEKYLRDGTEIDGTSFDGAIALSGLRYFPKPGSGLIEQEFELPSKSKRFSFFGKIDYLSTDYLDLRDWKTTSDYRYAKTKETAKTDPQTVLYGRYGVEKSKRDSIKVQYLYLLTKKDRRGARPLDLVVSRDDISEEFEKITDEAERLVEIRTNRPDPLSVTPNPEHCNDYGGCPHRGRCTDIHPLNVLGNFQVITKESLLASLKKSTAPVAETPPAPPARDEIAELEAKLAALKALPIAPVDAAIEKVVEDHKDLLSALARTEKTEAPVGLEPSSEAAEIEQPRKPGRPKGSKNKPKEVTEGAPYELGAGTPGEGKVHAIQATLVPIRTLYVSCMPLGDGDILIADTIFATVRKAVSEGCAVPHYRMIDYGKGPAIFAKALEEHLVKMLEAFDNEPFDVVLTLGSNEASDALPVLMSSAERVVRGF